MESAHIAPENDGKSDDTIDSEDKILQINRDNFKSILSKNKATIIAVFAKRCQACRELEP